MKFDFCSIPGPKGDNQDAISPPREIGSFWRCAIADGVGSSKNGGLAARESVQVVEDVEPDSPMETIFNRVREQLDSLVSDEVPRQTLSTTLSVLKIGKGEAEIGHVGDTRITHFRGGGVVLRTEDQTEVQKLLNDGVLSRHQAKRYPRRNVLLSAMSAGRDYDLYHNLFEVQDGDRILLTTDGFHEKIFRREIARISEANANFSSFWEELQRMIATSSFDDDASCIAIEI